MTFYGPGRSILTRGQYRVATWALYLSLGLPLLAGMWWLDARGASGPISYLVDMGAVVLYAYAISFWPKSYPAYLSSRSSTHS